MSDVKLIPERNRPQLPPYWRENRVALYHLHAAGAEMDEQRENDLDVARQMILATATWGLAYWEYLFQVQPKPGDTYDTRRARIMAKYRQRNPFTPALATEITHVFLTPEGQGHVEVMENVDTGAFVISVPLTTLRDLEEWIRAIEKRKRVPHRFIPNLFKGGEVRFSLTSDAVRVYINRFPICGTFSCGGRWRL
ncbi:YmfQ family protein [Brevibacillus humidisoli]|uniref:putative phage tail protein n=1 Tax=Brevibacillus humidisoli TaxID=2895522 RepID=UPI001E4F7345|nr:putative phage tail protein [Brevibacillus humidisoli]UFJ40095.1 YmfQ family protein [Brevibacillus humidisoli]